MYHKSSNRSRALNRRWASNTGQGSEHIIPIEAGPRIDAGPGIEAGVSVYILGGPLLVTELHVHRVIIWTSVVV